MRAAEKEAKRQKRLAAIKALIKKRQENMLLEDVLNKTHEIRQDDTFSDADEDGQGSPIRDTSAGLRKTQDNDMSPGLRKSKLKGSSPERKTEKKNTNEYK